jgi:hypothetical protein
MIDQPVNDADIKVIGTPLLQQPLDLCGVFAPCLH